MTVDSNGQHRRGSTLWRIPLGVWVLGVVSLLMDVSSEMIHSLLPVFLVAEIGLGLLAVGLIEGIAEAAASIAKAFSGAFSDWLGRRKLLAVAGYGLAALTGGRHVRDQGGTMFGVFHLVTGLATLLASLVAGVLWQQIGPTGTFGAGALLAALGILAVIVVLPRGP